MRVLLGRGRGEVAHTFVPAEVDLSTILNDFVNVKGVGVKFGCKIRWLTLEIAGSVAIK